MNKTEPDLLNKVSMLGRDKHLFDLDATLEFCQQDRALANQLLSMMLETVELDAENIRRAFLMESRSELRNLLHTIKGSCCYCRFEPLLNACEQLHNVLHTDDVDFSSAFVQQLFSNFMHRCQEIVELKKKALAI